MPTFKGPWPTFGATDKESPSVEKPAPQGGATADRLVVVAICGKARAGKDTAAQVLVSHGNFTRIALADGLKSLLNDLDGATWDFRKERDEANLSDRWAAQQAGTECREAVGDRDHWVSHLAIKIHYAHKVHPRPRSRFVVPDLRYPFEAERLRGIVESLGGRLEVWRVIRSGQADIKEAAHTSENSFDAIPRDRNFFNGGSLAQFSGLVADEIPHMMQRAAKPPRDEPVAAPKPTGDLAAAFERGEARATAALRLVGLDESATAASPGGQCGDCMTPMTCAYFNDCLGPATPPRQGHRIPRLNDPRDGSAPPPVLYLSGPMTGIESFNFPAFNKAAENLRQMGFPVLNPADFGWGESDWGKNLARDLALLGHAEILVQLPGWDTSRGASLEYNTAVSLGKGVASLGSILDLA